MNIVDRKILREGAFHGQSLLRVLHTIAAQRQTISGRTIDLGAKTRDSPYLRYLINSDATIEFSDKFSSHMQHEFDLEFDLPINDSTYNTVILMNVLEHIHNHKNLLKEIVRILKPDGSLIGFIPFLHPYHPDPLDEFRYTHTALESLMKEAGFKDISIIKVCVGRLLCLTHLATSRVAMPVRARFWIYILAIYLSDKQKNPEESGFYGGLAFSGSKAHSDTVLA